MIVAITGASAGIGRATALRLASDGAQVAVCARRRDRLGTVESEITAHGGQALAIEADVSRQADVDAFVQATLDRFGGLDVMICNAGFGAAGPIERLSPDVVRELVDVNLMGTFYSARAAMQVFTRQARGHLIIISSIVGRRGVPHMSAYAATKFAQVGLAECLRSECAGTNVHVTAVYPVSTDTEFFDVMSRVSGGTIHRAGPKQPVETVAEAIANAITRPVAEVFPYPKSRLLVWLNAVAPAYTDRFVKKFGRRLE
jgi:short-subunit dehydrogenase